MLDTATLTSNIQTVRELVPLNGTVAITFANGQQVTLGSDHPDRDLILQQAEGSQKRNLPVGFQAGPGGQLLDLTYAYEVQVQDVSEDPEDENRIRIGFWGFCAVCYLVKDHPECSRIRSALLEALQTHRRVWFAHHTRQEESDTEVWNRILDVRPAPSPAP